MPKAAALIVIAAAMFVCSGTLLAQGFTIDPTPLPVGMVGVPYSASLSASGGPTPHIWFSGDFPDPPLRLLISGDIIGTPNVATTYNFSVTVTNPVFQMASRSFSIQITETLQITKAGLADGTVGVLYSDTLTASGGTAPYTWSIEPGSQPLPDGLSLNGATISGVSGNAGTRNVNFRVTDAFGFARTAGLSITIKPPALEIVKPPFAEGTVGVFYSDTATVSGGTPPFTWTFSGNTPPGLAPNGATLSGTPSTAGTFQMNVAVRDSSSPAQTSQKPFSILIRPAPLLVTKPPFAEGTVGAPYSDTAAASGGTPPLTWVITGNVPGLTASGPTLSGTPTTAGSFPMNYQVTDSGVPQQSRQSGFQVVIRPSVLQITKSSFAEGTVGAAYSDSATASGGVPPYTWTFSGNIPPGLTPNGPTLSGSPTAHGSFAIKVRVTDSGGAFAQTREQDYTITIRPPTLLLTKQSFANGTVGAAYNDSATASGGVPPYSWSITNVPPGLTPSAATVSGTPTTHGNFTIRVSVSDSGGTFAQTKQQDYTIAIAPTQLQITKSSFAEGVVGAPYNDSATASGGVPPYSWTFTGNLPPGLSPSGPSLVGTPTTHGSFTFTARVTDSGGTFAQTRQQEYTIVIAPSVLSITKQSFTEGTVGVAYTDSATASGGVPPYSWTFSGNVPPGLTPNGPTLTGTPTTNGSFTFTVRVTDNGGNAAQAKQQDYTILIKPPALLITKQSFAEGTVGASYSDSATASGGVPPYSWTFSGNIPPGLTPNGPTLAGTPATHGNFGFTVRLTDSGGSPAQTKDYVIVIRPSPLQITKQSFAEGTVGVPYADSATASGGVPPYTWNITNTPPGLPPNAANISGTPTTHGEFKVIVRVNDSGGPFAQSQQREFVITIKPAPLLITKQAFAEGTVGVAYTDSATASGGVPPYTWTFSGNLPPGISPNAASLSGTPTTPGPFTFTASVTDSGGNWIQTKQQDFTIVIKPPTLLITKQSFAEGNVGVPYTDTATASGGIPPLTWTFSGNVPPGLSPNGPTLSGTPTTHGNFTFTLSVSDNGGGSVQTKQQDYTIVIRPPALLITKQSLAEGFVGTPYSDTVTASGGVPPFTWIFSGNIPPGLTPNGATLAGTPTTHGNFTITVRVSDNGGALAQTKQQDYTIVIRPPALLITKQSFLDGTVGVAYTDAATASGGVPPYSWTFSGTLPPGVSASGASLVGTPTTHGNYPVTVRVTDNGGAFAQTRQQDYTIIVRPPTLLITKSSFAEGTVGVVNYNEALTAGGGIPPYTWSVVSGTLPDGLSLIGNTIRGTPTTAGSFIFSVRAADNGGAFAQTQQQAFTIVIKPPPLVITKASLAEGTVGVAYNETLTAGGGTPPFTWSVISGNLPGGLSLNGAAITGTPTTAGSFPVTIRVADNGGSAAQTQQQAYTIVIKPPPLLITKESLIEGTVGVFYSDTVIGGGGTPPFTWSVITGNLPPGLTLTGSIISGTPTTQGTFPVTIRVADAGGTMAQTNQKAFSIIIRPAPLVIATQSLPATVTNVPYSQTLTANGGTAPFTWSAENLPPGLTLTGATISGTPTVPGTSNITIRITDAGTPQQTAQKTLSLLIVSTLTVTTPSPLPVGSAGFVYSLNLTALGGVANYAWSIVDGTLPPGINFGAGGSLAGTPTVTGSFNFTVRVTDSGIPQQTTQKSFELIIGTPITVANPSGLPRGVSGSAYSHTLTATGGTPDYRWAVIDGRFPPGLTLAGGGVISGTPLIDGTFSFTVRVTDSASPERTATAVVEIVISSVLAITTPPALPVAVIGFAYSRQLQASLQGPLTWSVLSGSLPQGLNLSEAGNITGTPAATGSFSFTVQVAGGTPQQGATRVFQLEVRGGLTITTPVVLPEGSVPIPYSLPLGASGGTPPYTWSVTSGTLPNGLTLSNSGLLGGTPAQTGTFTFTIRVTDTSNGTDSREFSLLIPQTGLQITTASLSTGIQSFAYSQQLEASGGPAPLTWALLSGALPPGLVLTPAGVLQGLPTTTGSANIRVGVSDSRGASDARDFVLAVGPAVPSLLLTGAPSAADPAQQLPLVLSLSQAYPLPLSGTLTISVTPGSAVPADDPALQFSSGGRTVNFTFPANSTTAEFSSPLFLLTGTVAGTIATSGSVRNGPPASVLASTSVRSTAPQITSVVVSRVSGGLRVQAIGFSSERRVTDAQFGFDVRSANGMERVNLTKVVEPEFSSWYQSSTSTPFGSTFLFEQMFAIQGDSNAVEGVTLTLANGQGSTTSARIPIP